ncbi:winged helix-turn-helix transcriptional regulator [Paenibacillus barcinonensis]|uniref:DNA-binding MarR family transcriptional regulator n=1 Tax=Paenibacillus barcinonensis TaxID=198119 RepID=A0A2V4W7H8_PAEBA|nr:MarR family winged helix-turn-helix transcriptional regulator [Paenibacillus barcinonensis]PYE51253.1 DNA-binding MarR family transcriptional regulator [Paenibacillus barcinonensis]QKS55658.1 winged helix-turn-helix transcriptional regulator [Paenibacillus barcinonensis]
MTDTYEVFYIINSFRQVNQMLFRAFWNENKEIELTSIQFMVLSILKERPSIGINDLAELSHMGSSSMSAVVERLVKGDYIERTRSDADRRSVMLQITAKGEKAQQETHQLWMERVSPILEIPKEDLEHLLHIHSLMIEKLQGREMNNL